MIGLTLKQLKYFDALARFEHFGRAAEACSISQPALSIQIKELEAMFGAPLVERGARKIRLTPMGEGLLETARRILLHVEELDDLMRAARGPLGGRLRLGIIPTAAPYLLPRLIGCLAEQFPDVDLTMRETVTPTLIRELLDGQLDIAVVALPISEPALEEFPLFTEEFVLVRPAAEASHPVPNAEALQAMRLLLLEEGHCFRDQALSFCRIDAPQTRQLMEGSSLSTLVQMVSAGMGVTLIPEMAVGLETRRADVSVARFPDPAPARRIGLVWRSTNPLADQLGRLGEILRSIGPVPAPARPL